MKSNAGNTASHFCLKHRFDTFRNREISIGGRAIQEQLADLDLQIITDYLLAGKITDEFLLG